MKKIIATTVGLMLVGGVAATSAMAFESQFGGYWRTRFTFDDNLRGALPAGKSAPIDEDGTRVARLVNGNPAAANNDTGSNYLTDTRTRLYYTAKFNDHFKFVNKFEFNTTWGDANGGDIGADGAGNFLIKNSYVDYTMGMVNATVGIQHGRIARGLLFDDDFSGAVVTADFGSFALPVLYATAVDEEVRSTPIDPYTKGDANMVAVMPTIKISDALQITPEFIYGNAAWGQNHALNTDFDATDLYWAGVDIDLKLDAVSAWGTFVYNGGQVDDNDVSAFLAAVGVDAGIVHGQAFYVSGDDDAKDTDRDEFQSPLGSSFYWSEIMGFGVFDNKASNGSPADHLTNIWAANVGVTLKPADKLTASFDAWYAQLVEDDVAGNNELGLEFDGKLTYALEDNLNVDLVFAYLVAGDATGDEDVIESGVQLSLAF